MPLPSRHTLQKLCETLLIGAVGGAILTFTGHQELPVLASSPDGRFRSGHLPPGQYRVAITAPESPVALRMNSLRFMVGLRRAGARATACRACSA